MPCLALLSLLPANDFFPVGFLTYRMQDRERNRMAVTIPAVVGHQVRVAAKLEDLQPDPAVAPLRAGSDQMQHRTAQPVQSGDDRVSPPRQYSVELLVAVDAWVRRYNAHRTTPTGGIRASARSARSGLRLASSMAASAA